MRTQCISDWKRFETFRNSSLFCTFLLLRNFYSGDVHHANHGKHSLNHELQHCAHSVYQIYSVLKLFKITVCFTHFGFYEISTPVVRIMLRQNSLNHHFQHCAHSVYQIYGVLKLFEIAVCFAHFGFYEISTPVMGPMETVVNIVQVIISDIGDTL